MLRRALATLLRFGVALISFIYFVALSPHIGSISFSHFSSGWFLAAALAALVWVPLILIQIGEIKVSDRLLHWLSFLLPVAMIAFFGLLWVATTTIR